MSKYNVGDQVRIVNQRGWGWNSDGEMDKYRGKVLTISKVDDFTSADDSLYTMEECPEWAWSNEDIAELVSSPADIEPTKPSKKTSPCAASIGYDIEIANLISEFIDDVLKVADKYNVDRRETLEAVVETVDYSVKDKFFWDVIVPMNDVFGKSAK